MDNEGCGFTPFNDLVLVRRDAAEAAPAAGIVMPGTDGEPPLTGAIVNVGAGLHDSPGRTPGNRIAFGKYAGVEVTVRGEVLLVMKDEEILGVFTD